MTIILHWSPDHGREESPMCCRGESIQRIIAVMLQWLPQITEIWDSKSQAQVIRGENYAPSWSCQGPSLRIKAEVSSTQQCEPAGGKVRYKKKPSQSSKLTKNVHSLPQTGKSIWLHACWVPRGLPQVNGTSSEPQKGAVSPPSSGFNCPALEVRLQ